MGAQHVIVIAVVAAAGVFLARALWKMFKSPSGCHCDQASRPPDARIKRTPMVTEIGRPDSHERR